MASFELTVDDSSPLITYAPAGAWTDSPPNDPSLSLYLDDSYHTTTQPGATATIVFNGTGISFFGGKRPEYGSYSLSIDGSFVNGTASYPSPVVNQLLGSVSGLTNELHTAILTSEDVGLDLDWIQLQTHMGQQSIRISNTTIDDASQNITYGPSASDWNLVPGTVFIDNTSHYSIDDGAYASVTFMGGAVAIYGTFSPNRSETQVTLDGEVTTIPSGPEGSAQQFHTQSLLYYRSNIGNQIPHSLVLSVDSQQEGGYIDLDAVIVFRASPGNSTVTPSNTKDLFTGTVIFAVSVTASVVFILVMVILLLVLRRRRQQKMNTAISPVMRSPQTPDLPIQRPKLMEDGFNFSPEFGPLESKRNSVQSASSMTPMLVNTVRLKIPQPPGSGRILPQR